MMRRYIIIGGILVVLSGIVFLAWTSNPLLAQESGGWNLFAVSLWSQLKGILGLGKSVLTVAEQTEITAAKRAIIESDGHNYSSLYALLASVKGNRDKIYAVCQEFNPIYCLRQASQQNSSLRQEICERLVSEVNRRYQGRVNATQHQRECLLGLPKYAY
jgi:hypothetical protein